MRAEEILQASPRTLFPGDEADTRKRFKQLAALWHPDLCTDPQCSQVFQHVLKCRDAALKGDDDVQSQIFTRKDWAASQPVKQKFRLAYMRSAPFEAGRLFVTKSNVAYLVGAGQEKLAEQAKVQRWQFFDNRMQEEMSKYLPRQSRVEHTTDGTLMVYSRTSDQILLSDLLEFSKLHGGIDYRHVMWMISSLLNTCSYLEVTRTSHCALLPHYLLVSPDMHSVAITGPALYATPWGNRPKAVPQEVLAAYPQLRVKTSKVEDSSLDLTMVRRVAMLALGHTNPALLARDDKINAGLRQWVTSPAPASAVKDYVLWEKLRGKRAFTPYETTAGEMYVALSA